MTTEEAMKEYSEFIYSIKENYLANLPKDVPLQENEKSKAENEFFPDFDTKANFKAKQLIDQFPSLGDKAVLNNRFMTALIKLNSEFKQTIKDWNTTNVNNPTEDECQ